MEQISSKEILLEFLNKELVELITRKEFEKILTKASSSSSSSASTRGRGQRSTIPNIKIDQLYEQLVLQKSQVHLKKISRRINKLNLVEKYKPHDKTTMVELEDYELVSLVKSMGNLQRSIDDEVNDLQLKCDRELETLNSNIDSLNDLKYGSMNFQDSVKSLENELKVFETKLVGAGADDGDDGSGGKDSKQKQILADDDKEAQSQSLANDIS